MNNTINTQNIQHLFSTSFRCPQSTIQRKAYVFHAKQSTRSKPLMPAEAWDLIKNNPRELIGKALEKGVIGAGKDHAVYKFVPGLLLRMPIQFESLKSDAILYFVRQIQKISEKIIENELTSERLIGLPLLELELKARLNGQQETIKVQVLRELVAMPGSKGFKTFHKDGILDFLLIKYGLLQRTDHEIETIEEGTQSTNSFERIPESFKQAYKDYYEICKSLNFNAFRINEYYAKQALEEMNKVMPSTLPYSKDHIESTAKVYCELTTLIDNGFQDEEFINEYARFLNRIYREDLFTPQYVTKSLNEQIQDIKNNLSLFQREFMSYLRILGGKQLKVSNLAESLEVIERATRAGYKIDMQHAGNTILTETGEMGFVDISKFYGGPEERVATPANIFEALLTDRGPGSEASPIMCLAFLSPSDRKEALSLVESFYRKLSQAQQQIFRKARP